MAYLPQERVAAMMTVPIIYGLETIEIEIQQGCAMVGCHAGQHLTGNVGQVKSISESGQRVMARKNSNFLGTFG